MKKLFLMGRSEAGKTSLTQALKGEELHYEKTQYTITADDTIDSPGEYAESKQFGAGLACFSFEADVVGIVQAADEPYNLFSPCLRTFILRPLIGIIISRSSVSVDDDVSTSDDSVDMDALSTSTITMPMSRSGGVNSIVGMIESHTGVPAAVIST